MIEKPFVQGTVMVLYVLLVTVLSILFIPWLVPRLICCFIAGWGGGYMFRKLVNRKKNEPSRKTTFAS